MGNFFSGTNQNSISDSYAKTDDLSKYAKTSDIPNVSSFINKDVNN